MNGYPQFNGWRATRSLGVGKTGETFEISRSDGFGTSETGALKRIHVPTEEDYEAQQEQRAQLEEVAQALRAADALSEHPNILPWRDHEIRTAEDGDGWDICLRADLATPLEQYIRTHTYGERDVISMASGICTLLSICHSRGLVHGDIKPQNLFVNEAGYDGRPALRLGDFGNAPLVPDAAGDFASPEVLCGDAPNAQDDLYSLGMVLYWLLNDKRVPYAPSSPAPGAADLAIARDMRLRGDPMPVPAHGSAALQRVIMTAIADRPEDRYRTADEFREALQEIAQASDERRAQAERAQAERAQRAAALQAQQMQQAQAREARMQREQIEEEPEKKRSVLPIVIGSLCGLIVLALALMLIISGIGSKDKKDDKGEISYLKLSQTEVEVAPDEKVSLVCTAYDSDNHEVTDADLGWSTSDQGIATVSTSGEVTGHKEGTAVITVSVKEDDDVDPVKCTVKVTKDAVKVERITLNETSKELDVDDTLRLSYELSPAKASAGEVKWTSSDKAVATVDSEGVVTAVGTGTATIKVTVSNGVNDKELSASCVVTVAEKAKVSRVIANDSSVSLTAEGATVTISFTVTGKNVDEFSDRVSIRPDDGSILQLSNIKRSGYGDSNGISSVNFVITDTAGQHSASTTVTVDIPFTPEPTPTPTPTPSAEPAPTSTPDTPDPIEDPDAQG